MLNVIDPPKSAVTVSPPESLGVIRAVVCAHFEHAIEVPPVLEVQDTKVAPKLGFGVAERATVEPR